jgi:NADPH-dependent glutamate synthase beta subunit-like oxidoreductase
MTNLPIYTSAKQGYEAFDGDFLLFLDAGDKDAFSELTKARQQGSSLSPEYLIKTAIIFEAFLCDKFDLHKSLELLNNKYNLSKDIIFVKRYVVMRVASKKYPSLDLIDLKEVLKLKQYFTEQGFYTSDEYFDKSFAEFILTSAKNETKNDELYDKLLQYAAFVLLSDDGKALHKDSSLFNIPQKIDWMRLFDFTLNTESNLITTKKQIDRKGFDLFDKKPKSTEASWQANYCIYCHNQNKDYCRTGFDEVKQGCPLDQKISEMNFAKSKGYHLAALVIAMLDNPLVLLTGRRICNDCSKACIYQKTTPVDIPSLESQIVEDCLYLPYGFELYNLLTLYNPLETDAYNLIANKTLIFNSKNVVVAGLGPAGIASAHYLTKHGVSVLAIDGLALSPLKQEYFEPIKDCSHILQQNLEGRTSGAFGGVMEYGITARWNKNLLELAKIILFRRANFKAHGGIRFDGNFHIKFFAAKGFDYAVLALGSGEPKLSLEGIKGLDSIKAGFITSSNFLMSLHSSYAFAGHSIDNENIINLKNPVFVLGGGLTATDCATEALALLKAKGVRNPEVSILYHKRLQDSPAYRLNHDELEDCMAQGVKFYQNTSVTLVNHKDGVLDSLSLNNGITVKAGTIITAFGTEQKSISLDKDCGLAYKIIGDMNPEYSGSVVKAIASAKNNYIDILHYLLDSGSKSFDNTLDFSSKVLSVSKAEDGFVKLTIKSNFINYYKVKPADICKIQVLNSGQFKPMPITIADVDYANNTLDLYIKQCGRASKALIKELNIGDNISLTPSPSLVDYAKYQRVIIYNNSPNADYAVKALKSYLTKQGILVFTFNDLEEQSVSKLDGKTLLFAILLDDVDLNELKTSCKADDIYVLKHKDMQCMLKGVCSKCLFFDETSQNFKYACKV